MNAFYLALKKPDPSRAPLALFLLPSALLLFSTLLASFVPIAHAQSVSTLTTSLGVDGDGITVSPVGDIYVAGGGPTTVVLKITPAGDVSTFAQGIQSPVGIFMNSEGHFFVANYRVNAVSKISPAGEVTTFATEMNGPAGVVINAEDEVFIAEFGENFSGQGRAVQKFALDGSKTTFIDGQGLQDPIGIAIDEEGIVYVSNWNSGEIYRSDGTTVSLFAEIGGRVNQITYSGGYLYVPSPSLRKIFRVDREGNVEHVAGSGATGTSDGSAMEASFIRPNGIAAAPDGETFYIVDAGARAIRVLHLGTSTGTGGEAQPEGFDLLQNYPNPFNPTTVIPFSLARPGHVTLTVTDLLGRVIAVLVDEPRAAGSYAVPFDASALACGSYMYRIHAGNYTATRLLTLVK